MFNACYKFVKTIQGYDSHVTGCASAWSGDSKWESYLASIHDEYENHLAAALTYDESVQFDQTYSKDGFWIGFKGDASRGWRTEHQEGLPTFTRWATDEPKSITSGNLCSYVDLEGFWHSESCTLTKAGFQTKFQSSVLKPLILKTQVSQHCVKLHPKVLSTKTHQPIEENILIVKTDGLTVLMIPQAITVSRLSLT